MSKTVKCDVCGVEAYLPLPSAWRRVSLGGPERLLCHRCAEQILAAVLKAKQELQELMSLMEAS